MALYLGNDRMIAAPEPGDRVKIQSVYETPSSIRRVLPSGPAGATNALGMTSLTGLAGVTGLAGLSGLSGLTGAAGLGPAAGLNGLAGLSGLAGMGSAGQPVTGVSQYAGLFAQAEARYQLPQGLLAAVAQTESGGIPPRSARPARRV